MELALFLGGSRPKKGSMRIKEKQAQARAGGGRYPPLSDDAEVWKRITLLYAETVEARHSLVHRKFNVDSSGSMGIANRTGEPMPSLTAAEQEALCRVAQMVLGIGISQRWNARERAYLSWSLDKLARHHGQPPLGGSAARPVEIVRIDARRSGEDWVADLANARAHAARAFAHSKFVDIEIHFPNSGLPPITGRLEEAPGGSAVTIDPSNPPEWVKM